MRKQYHSRKARGVCGNCCRTPRPGRAVCDHCVAKAIAGKKKRGKAHARDLQLSLRYGITQDHYQQLYNGQKGLCPVCKKPLAPVENTFANCIDHSHTTGFIRGILHRGCNLLVGSADNPLIHAALEYVRTY